MATVRPYINHLLQNVGITPACSEEERAAAEDIAQIFANHGFDPELQEFSASGAKKLVAAGLGIAAFIGAVLLGIGGVLGVIGLLLLIAAAVIFTMERRGKAVLSGIGAGGLSQNVIAYHKASGPLASPRNRPVVVVAHYDSPRADVLSQFPYASYRPALVKLLPYAMVAPAVVAVIRLLPLPGAVKVILWLLAIVIALVPLANAVATIMNRAVLPYTSGAVCNKSSVAAMLGVMDAVSPYKGADEFPGDVPFDEFFAEQRRIADELAYEASQVQMSAEEAATEEAEGQPQELSDEGGSMDTENKNPTDDSLGAATGLDARVSAMEGADSALSEPLGEAGLSGRGAEIADAALTAVIPGAPAGPASDGSDGADAEKTIAFSYDDESFDATKVIERSSEEEQGGGASAEGPDGDSGDEGKFINAEGNYRFGLQSIRLLGMLPDSCDIEYVAPEPPAPSVSDEPAPEIPSAEEVDIADSSNQDAPMLEDAGGELDPVDEGDVADPFTTVVMPAEKVETCEETERGTVEEAFDDGSDDIAASYISSDDEANEEDFPAGYAVPHRKPIVRPPHVKLPSRTQVQVVMDTAATIFQRIKEVLEQVLARAKDLVAEIRERIEESRVQKELPEENASQKQVSVEQDADILDKTMEHTIDDLSATMVSEPVDAGYDKALSDGDDDAPEAANPSDTIVAEASEDGAEAETEALDEESLPDGDTADASEDDDADDSSDGEGGSVYSEPSMEGTVDQPISDGLEKEADEGGDSGATQAIDMSEAPSPDDAAEATVEQRPIETVDSLMAEISGTRPLMPRTIPDPAKETLYQKATSDRASLFDLPDPSENPSDPFAPQQGASTLRSVAASAVTKGQPAATEGFAVIGSADEPAGHADAEEIGVITAEDSPAPQPAAAKPHRGLSGLFHRRKKKETSMSEYLGVDDDFDAKSSGREIGSWDNFEDDDWKGGATGSNASEEELRDAITSMGDDELLGHDIWFVATGASEYDNAGMKAFLAKHRDKLRGVFLINLECVGAGQVMMLSTEGEERVLKGDKRIMNLVSKVSHAFHNEYGAIEMPYVTTDAHVAMNRSLRALTLAGIDGPSFACSHSMEDAAYNVDVNNINMVADVVTEVIRRS